MITFQSLLFGSLAKFHNSGSQVYKLEASEGGLSKAWFASTNVTPQVVDRFLRLVSATPAEFNSSYDETNEGISDFTPFRDRPLFRDGEFLFLIDFAYLAEKFETAPFWTIHGSLTDKRARDGFHSFWGMVFEKYGCDILRDSALPPLNVMYESPTFVNKRKGQVCDAIIACGNSAAFIELKGTTFSSKAKYGGDYRRLKTELERNSFRKPTIAQKPSCN